MRRATEYGLVSVSVSLEEETAMASRLERWVLWLSLALLLALAFVVARREPGRAAAGETAPPGVVAASVAP